MTKRKPADIGITDGACVVCGGCLKDLEDHPACMPCDCASGETLPEDGRPDLDIDLRADIAEIWDVNSKIETLRATIKASEKGLEEQYGIRDRIKERALGRLREALGEG